MSSPFSSGCKKLDRTRNRVYLSPTIVSPPGSNRHDPFYRPQRVSGRTNPLCTGTTFGVSHAFPCVTCVEGRSTQRTGGSWGGVFGGAEYSPSWERESLSEDTQKFTYFYKNCVYHRSTGQHVERRVRGSGVCRRG